MKKVNFIVEDGMHKKLRLLSAETGESTTKLLIRLIEKYFAKMEQENENRQ